jgi:multicomponent Na+:H+ antiporter subunit G
MAGETLKDVLTVALLLIGTCFMVLAAVGLLRMPDLFTRMHAATKMPTLAMTCMLLAVAVHFGALSITTRALLGIAFFFLTVPVAAQRIGRAAYFHGIILWSGSIVNELAGRTGPEGLVRTGGTAEKEGQG